MARSYPPEFRKRVLDRLDAGHSVTAIAQDLGDTERTYNVGNNCAAAPRRPCC
jgi:transposase-like protein